MDAIAKAVKEQKDADDLVILGMQAAIDELTRQIAASTETLKLDERVIAEQAAEIERLKARGDRT